MQKKKNHLICFTFQISECERLKLSVNMLREELHERKKILTTGIVSCFRKILFIPVDSCNISVKCVIASHNLAAGLKQGNHCATKNTGIHPSWVEAGQSLCNLEHGDTPLPSLKTRTDRTRFFDFRKQIKPLTEALTKIGENRKGLKLKGVEN